MDIVSGITAVSQALALAREIREIDRSVDESTFKLKLSELQSSLADAKVALSDAKVSLSELNEQIMQMEKRIDEVKNGDFCPKCRSGRMMLQNVKPHTYMALGRLGVEDWTHVCSEIMCGFEQVRIIDPHGVVPAAARKK